MANKAQKPSTTTDAQNQAYDNICKRLIEGQPQEIIALLFPDLEPLNIEELTVEILLPPRRMDKVYLVTRSTGKVILHLEIEAAPKNRGQMSRRMLVYHALLLEKYNSEAEQGFIPVITYVIYPFTRLSGLPHVFEEFESEEILHFKHREILLKTLDARQFMQAHAVPLYGLLPVMEHTSEGLLNQAIEDMVHYYENQDNTDRLRDELLCFQLLLRRAKRLPPVELENVLRRLRMYDPLLEEDPWVQEYGNKLKNLGREEGREEGKEEATKQNIALVVQARFASLERLAAVCAEQVQNLDILKKLLVAMSKAKDENEARAYLLSFQNEGQ